MVVIPTSSWEKKKVEDEKVKHINSGVSWLSKFGPRTVHTAIIGPLWTWSGAHHVGRFWLSNLYMGQMRWRCSSVHFRTGCPMHAVPFDSGHITLLVLSRHLPWQLLCGWIGFINQILKGKRKQKEETFSWPGRIIQHAFFFGVLCLVSSYPRSLFSITKLFAELLSRCVIPSFE